MGGAQASCQQSTDNWLSKSSLPWRVRIRLMDVALTAFLNIKRGLRQVLHAVERSLEEVDKLPSSGLQDYYFLSGWLKETYKLLANALQLLLAVNPKRDKDTFLDIFTHPDASLLLEEGSCMLATLTACYPQFVHVCFLDWQRFNEAMYELGFLQLDRWGPWKGGCFRVSCDNQLMTRLGKNGNELVHAAGSPMVHSPKQCGTVLNCSFLAGCYAFVRGPSGPQLIACTEAASAPPYNANSANQFDNPDTGKQCSPENNQCVITSHVCASPLQFVEGRLVTPLPNFVDNMFIATSLMLHKGITLPHSQHYHHQVNVYYGDVRDNWTVHNVTAATPNNLQDWLIQNLDRPSDNCYFLDLTGSMSKIFLDFIVAFRIPLQGATPGSRITAKDFVQANQTEKKLAFVAWPLQGGTADLQLIECTSPIQEGATHMQSPKLDLSEADDAFYMDVVDNVPAPLDTNAHFLQGVETYPLILEAMKKFEPHKPDGGTKSTHNWHQGVIERDSIPSKCGCRRSLKNPCYYCVTGFFE